MPLTSEDRRKGGWGRARQWALWRKENPSSAEKTVLEFITGMGITGAITEYEIYSDRPQWIDIFIPAEFSPCGVAVAIEVDGSHGWHDFNGDYEKNMKMALYDELKARWCFDHGVLLIRVRCSGNWKEVITNTIERVKYGKEVF